MRREGKQQDTQPKNTMSREGTAWPADATLTLVVQSMAYTTTEEDLKAAFEKYGAVKRVNVLKKEDGLSKGTAFADFTKLEHAAKAFSAMQGVELDGRALKIKFKGDRADANALVKVNFAYAGYANAFNVVNETKVSTTFMAVYHLSDA